MALPDFIKHILGLTDDSAGTVEQLDFDQLYASRLRFGRDVLTLDQLPSDPQERYTVLEEQVRILSDFMDSADTHHQKFQDALRQREIGILHEDGFEGGFAYDIPFQILSIGPDGLDFMSFNLPSGAVLMEIGEDEEEVRESIKRIKDALSDEAEQLAAWEQEVFEHVAGYQPLLAAFGVDYAKVDLLGERNLNHNYALALCTGKTHSREVYIDLVTGQIEDDQEVAWKKDEVLRDKFRAEFENNHAECAHDTYILSHPSEHVAVCHLAGLSPKILENYIVSLTMH